MTTALRGLLIGCPLFAIAIAWSPGFEAPYQYDDYVTPVKDPASQSLSDWARALPGTLRPLTKLSFAVESSLGATSAPARRVFNGLVFLLSAALIGLLAHVAGLARAEAAALASLWAVHPVHAETVIALAGRSVLLSLCLQLLSVAALLRERRGLAVGCAVLAVLARETAWPWLVVASAIAAADPASSGAELRRRVGLATLCASMIGAVLVLSSSRLRGLLDFAFHEPRAVDRLGLQWAALSKGTWMLFAAPNAFTVDVDFSPQGWSRFLLILATAVLYGAAVWLAARASHPLPLRILAALWLCLVLPLHSVIPKLDPFTARSFSASAAPLLLILGVLARRLASRARFGHLIFPVVVALSSLALIPTTRARAALYQDPIALWQDAAERSSKATRPLINLATLLSQVGRLDEARLVLEQALRRDRTDREALERLEAVHVLIETRRMLKPSQESHESNHE